MECPIFVSSSKDDKKNKQKTNHTYCLKCIHRDCNRTKNNSNSRQTCNCRPIGSLNIIRSYESSNEVFMHLRHTFSPVMAVSFHYGYFSDCVDSFYFIRNSERLWLPIKISLVTSGPNRTTLPSHTTQEM